MRGRANGWTRWSSVVAVCALGAVACRGHASDRSEISVASTTTVAIDPSAPLPTTYEPAFGHVSYSFGDHTFRDWSNGSYRYEGLGITLVAPSAGGQGSAPGRADLHATLALGGTLINETAGQDRPIDSVDLLVLASADSPLVQTQPTPDCYDSSMVGAACSTQILARAPAFLSADPLVLRPGEPLRLDATYDVTLDLSEDGARQVVDTIHDEGDLGVIGVLVILNHGGGYDAILLDARGALVSECSALLTIGPTDIDALERCVGRKVPATGG